MFGPAGACIDNATSDYCTIEVIIFDNSSGGEVGSIPSGDIVDPGTKGWASLPAVSCPQPYGGDIFVKVAVICSPNPECLK